MVLELRVVQAVMVTTITELPVTQELPVLVVQPEVLEELLVTT